ncbi:MAG: hypothetical protein IJY46_04795 [Lentisphaeria bacterium]|nr:hypothetical protein [Lentisphaeria bacterium]
MFGLAWMSMVSGILPLILFALFTCFGGFTDVWKIIAAVVCLFLLSIPAYAYGYILCMIGVSKICQSAFKNKTIGNIAGAVGSWLLPLLGLLLVPVLIVRKKFSGVGFALAGSAFFLLSYFKYLNIISCLFLGTGCCFAALALCDDKNKFSWKFAVPFGIALASHLFLFGYNVKLQYDVKHYRNELSQLIGRSVEVDDFWRRDAQGVPSDSRELKALIAARPESSHLEYEFENSGVARTKLREYEKKYPSFVQAVDEFLQLPESHVGHQIPEDGMLLSVLMPELGAFREAARHRAMKAIANSGDKVLVRKCNADMIKLRNWALQSEFSISLLVAAAIEHIRLNALTVILGEGGLPQKELEELVGAPVDWEKFLRYSFGCEAAGFKSAVDHLQMSASLPQMDVGLGTVKKYMPLFMHTHFLRDYRFALQYFIKACSVPPELSGEEKAQWAEVDENEIKRNSYFLSGMLTPAIGVFYRKTAQVADQRKIVLLSAEIMEYRKRHGKLPENLDFLPAIPAADLDHRPLTYEKTEDGFEIYSSRHGAMPNIYEVKIIRKK